MTKQVRVGTTAIVIAATLTALWYGVVLPIVCEARVSRALRDLTQASVSTEARRREAGSASLASLRVCRCLEQFDFKVAYARGTAFHLAGDVPQAIASYQRALATARRPELYFALGLSEVAAGDEKNAAEHFAQAAAFDPRIVETIPDDTARAAATALVRERWGSDWIP